MLKLSGTAYVDKSDAGKAPLRQSGRVSSALFVAVRKPELISPRIDLPMNNTNRRW